MIEPVKIYDSFYTNEELGLVGFEIFLNYFKPNYQPHNNWYPNRFQAYPCYETGEFNTESLLYKMLHLKLNILLDNKIDILKTYLRKTISAEIEDKSIFKSNSSLKHQDSISGNSFDLAGLIYLNTFSILDGTRLFTAHATQNEPDIVVGSKMNRLIIYRADTWHEPGYDKHSEVRYIQPFFIKLKK